MTKSEKLSASSLHRWRDPILRDRLFSGIRAAWADSERRALMTRAQRNRYATRYPWLPADRYDEMRMLVKKVGRATAEAALRSELKG